MAGINQYGDERRLAQAGFGVDVATQRADDLDKMALEDIAQRDGEVFALDIACGQGGQALRMAQAGAHVTACDVVDYDSEIKAAANAANLSIKFVLSDMRHLLEALPAGRFHVVTCQRAIHYLPFSDALVAVRQMRRLLAPGARLYISASGIRSELGDQYTASASPVQSRYAPLSASMVEKHGIHGPVCLYDERDLVFLMTSAGMDVEKIYSSPFGNVKAIGHEG